MRLSTALAALFLLFSAPATAQDSVKTLLEAKLMSRLQAMDREMAGVLGVAAIDLQTGAIFQYNGDIVFPQASSIKIPIMTEVFRQAEAGKLNFDTRVTLGASDAVGGSGEMQANLRSGPVTVTIRELVNAMIRTSDNTATNRLIAIAGMDNVNRWIADAGLKKTKLQRIMLDSKAAIENRENISTPLEMAQIAEMLYRGKAVSVLASKEMVGILQQVKADFRSAIPAAISVAAKPGELNGVRAETGIVFLPNRPFVLSVMSTFLDEGGNPVPAVARMFHEHFQKLANSNRYGHKLQ